MEFFPLNFLSQSYEDIWENYCYVRNSNSIQMWDYIIITASDETQAQMYRLQIQKRLDSGFLPATCNYLCIPDPEGKRVGSGGATLSVIKQIIRECGIEHIQNKRILLIHSGGDSKRIPQYSACGKLFSPVPRLLPDGTTSTLFDEFFIQLSSMPERAGGGMLVLSGDVLLLFNPLQVSLESKGATAISIKAPAETGSHHGVFLGDSEGYVAEFLHKQNVQSLREKGAVNAQGNVDIDTGLVWLSGELVSELASLVTSEASFQKFVNEQARLSFYGDFLYPLALHATEHDYYRQGAEFEINEALLTCRKKLWDLLHGFRLAITKLSPAQFLHFGTTEELRLLTTSMVHEYQQFGWNRHVLSFGIKPESSYACHMSWIGGSVSIGEGSYIEDSLLASGTSIGARCVVSSLNGPSLPFSIPDDTAVHQLQLQDKSFCTRFYGVHDNPKQDQWFGKPINKILADLDIPHASVFDGPDSSLWNARLFPAISSREESFRWMEEILAWVTTGIIEPDARKKWMQASRMSLASSFQAADAQAILEWQEFLETKIRASLFCQAIEREDSHQQATLHLNRKTNLVHQLDNVLDMTEDVSLSSRLRLYKSISLLLPDGVKLRGKSASDYEDLCYQALSDEVVKKHVSAFSSANTLPQPVGSSVTVELPVRINWGGGWSDTPPYCFDFGGTVLNAAITVRGRKPVQAKTRGLADLIVRFICEDGGISSEFTSLEPLLACSNPKDPFALHKAVLLACGVLQEGKGGLQDQLSHIGGGIELRTRVSVPKGSGLGASSVLAGACVKAVARLLGMPSDEDTLCYLALCVEQLMSTGGGWQDQVGGLVPGIKLIQTKPGLQQTFSIQKIILADTVLAELRERFVLVYTGQRRLARNILRDVVGKMLTREPRIMEVMQEIQRLAVLMAYELQRGRITEFAKLLDEHWKLSVELDGGTTNTCIDYIFSCCEEFIDGRFIAGAGGGGFLMMILKKGKTRAELEARLEEMFQDSGVAIWDCDFAMEG